MRDKIYGKIGLWAELLLGAVLLITVLQHYLPRTERMYEMTFLSNMAGAAVLLGDGLLGIFKKRSLPPWMQFPVITALLVVVLITVGCTLSGYKAFGLGGGMAFLHIINPVGAVLWFILWGGAAKGSWKQCFTAPLFCMAYLVFDWLRSFWAGRYVYGLLPIDKMTLPLTLLAGAAAYLGLLLLCALLLASGKGVLFHLRKREKIVKSCNYF